MIYGYRRPWAEIMNILLPQGMLAGDLGRTPGRRAPTPAFQPTAFEFHRVHKGLYQKWITIRALLDPGPNFGAKFYFFQ